jgi:CBS domain-containing membrane protein
MFNFKHLFLEDNKVLLLFVLFFLIVILSRTYNYTIMKKNVPVSEIMTKNIIKLNLSDELTKAEELFKKHKIRHIPVVSDNKIVGMLSYTDLLRVSYADAVEEDADNVESIVFNMFSVRQVMVKEVVIISPTSTIRETASILSKNEFHASPVCEGEILVGIVTTTDVIKYFLEQYQ